MCWAQILITSSVWHTTCIRRTAKINYGIEKDTIFHNYSLWYRLRPQHSLWRDRKLMEECNLTRDRVERETQWPWRILARACFKLARDVTLNLSSSRATSNSYTCARLHTHIHIRSQIHIYTRTSCGDGRALTCERSILRQELNSHWWTWVIDHPISRVINHPAAICPEPTYGPRTGYRLLTSMVQQHPSGVAWRRVLPAGRPGFV